MRLNLLIAILSFCFLPQAFAAGQVQLSQVDQRQKSQIGLGGEFAQLQGTGLSLTGYGASLYYQLALNSSFAVRPQASQVIGAGNSYLYTALGGFLTYAVTGSYLSGTTDFRFKDDSIVMMHIPETSTLSVGVGMEQLFLNGTQALYSAPGIAVLFSYRFPLFEQWLTAGCKLGQYQSGDNKIQGTMINLSIPLQF